MSSNEILGGILDEILAAHTALKQNQPVSDVAQRMPGINATSKPLAYALLEKIHNKSIGPDSSVEERRSAYIHYTKLKASLKKKYLEQNPVVPPSPPRNLDIFHRAKYSIDHYQQAKNLPVSDLVLYPTAMPVNVANYEELKDFFYRLQTPTKASNIYEQFTRGTYHADGRMDLCKQVVGPDHIDALMQSIRLNSNIEHFLLGNNIIGGIGATAIAAFIRDPAKLTNIKTWYLAGNCIDSDGMELIADALADDVYCKDLWLKRNPIGIRGAYALAKMLENNKTIETLDLCNVAIMDEGCIAIFEALKNNKTLRNIYLDANALTVKSADAIASYFYHKSKESVVQGLTHLSIGINRLEDAGAIVIADALLKSRYPLISLIISSNRIELDGLKHILDYAAACYSLQVLDVGHYKSTGDMGELPNSLGAAGAQLIAKFIAMNTGLRYLSFNHTHILDSDMSVVIDAAKNNTNLYWITAEQQPSGSYSELFRYCARNSGKHLSENKKIVRNLKHMDSVWVIDSIYRNES